ncbi:MAG: carbonic anhydrase/acetyltransferase-like protein (isoleucine patch superfamily) [bacterium]|jgi:carbonic anhydrase/acetyltransferase-like protein (isoleucine patch superfamily)
MTLYHLQSDDQKLISIPQIDNSVFCAPSADIIGRVSIGKNSSVWFNTVIRGDTDPITIGNDTNIQDLSMCHADPNQPLIIGNQVTVGHRCILHGCTIEDLCLIGMGAIIMNGAKIGKGSIVGAGAVVLENTIIPPYSLVTGSPAKVKKTYEESIVEIIAASAQTYVDRGNSYRNSPSF